MRTYLENCNPKLIALKWQNKVMLVLTVAIELL